MKIKYLILFLLLSIVFSEKREKKKSNKKQKTKIDSRNEIETLYDWAKKNNIFINEKLHLNKNTDPSHNFYYFTSEATIPNNTLLLRVPYDIMISESSLEKHFQEKNNINCIHFIYLLVKNFF